MAAVSWHRHVCDMICDLDWQSVVETHNSTEPLTREIAHSCQPSTAVIIVLV